MRQLILSNGLVNMPGARTLRAVFALVLREMSTSYGRSPGGYAWVIFEQLGVLLILSLAFSMFLKNPALGTSFILFYATGFLPFKMYQEVSSKTALALRFSKPLLVYPAITFMDAVLARFVLTVLTQVMVGYLIIVAILWWQDARAIVAIGPILHGTVLAACFGLSVGLVNAVLFDFLPPWKTAFSVATRPLLLASGVIFLFEDLPAEVRDILWFNPLIHIISTVRPGIYPFYEPNYVSTIYVWALSGMLGVMGLILLRRHHRSLLGL